MFNVHLPPAVAASCWVGQKKPALGRPAFSCQLWLKGCFQETSLSLVRNHAVELLRNRRSRAAEVFKYGGQMNNQNQRRVVATLICRSNWNARRRTTLPWCEL